MNGKDELNMYIHDSDELAISHDGKHLILTIWPDDHMEGPNEVFLTPYEAGKLIAALEIGAQEIEEKGKQP